MHFEKPRNAALTVDVVSCRADVVTSKLSMSLVVVDVVKLTNFLGNSQFPVISQCRDDVATLKSSVVDYFHCRDIAFPVLQH